MLFEETGTKTHTELGQEYLSTAEKIKEQLKEAKADPRPDLNGERAKRIRYLAEMYWECRVMGHYLLRRGSKDSGISHDDGN